MPRTDEDEVQSLLGAQYYGSSSLTIFIGIANKLTTRMNTCAVSKGYSFDSDELRYIEALLAAHAYGLSDQFVTSESTDGASATYQGQTGMGLQASKFGQTALIMDHSGCLKALTEGNRASAVWLGKNVKNVDDSLGTASGDR